MSKERRYTEAEIVEAWRRMGERLGEKTPMVHDLLVDLDRPRYRDDLPVMYDCLTAGRVTFARAIGPNDTNIRPLIPVDVVKRLLGVYSMVTVIEGAIDDWVETGEMPE